MYVYRRWNLQIHPPDIQVTLSWQSFGSLNVKKMEA